LSSPELTVRFRCRFDLIAEIECRAMTKRRGLRCTLGHKGNARIINRFVRGDSRKPRFASRNAGLRRPFLTGTLKKSDVFCSWIVRAKFLGTTSRNQPTARAVFGTTRCRDSSTGRESGVYRNQQGREELKLCAFE